MPRLGFLLIRHLRNPLQSGVASHLEAPDLGNVPVLGLGLGNCLFDGLCLPFKGRNNLGSLLLFAKASLNRPTEHLHLGEFFNEHLLSVVVVVIQPVLNLRQQLCQSRAVNVFDERPVLAAGVDAAPHRQDVGLEVVPPGIRVFDLVHIGYHAVLVRLSFRQLHLGQTGTPCRGHHQVGAPHYSSPSFSAGRIPSLQRTGALAISVSSRGASIRRCLLLLDQLRRSNLEGAMHSQRGPNFDLFLFWLCWELHLVRAELPRQARRQILLTAACIRCGQLEGSFPKKGHDLRQIHQRVWRKDHCRPLARPLCLLRLAFAILRCRGLRRAHPSQAYREGHRVLDLEWPGLVRRGQHCCHDSATSGHALVRVHGRGQLLAAKRLRAHLLDPRDSRGPTAHFHYVDAGHGDTAIVDGTCEHGRNLVHHRLAHFQKIQPVDFAGEVLVLHEALTGDARFGVRRQDLLGLGHRILELEKRLLIGQYVATRLLLELLCENPDQALVHVPAADLGGLLTQDRHLALDESANGHREDRVAHHAESDGVRLLHVERVRPPIPVLERYRRVLVHQPQHLKAGDFRGIEQGHSLEVREVAGHTNNGLLDHHARPRLRDVFQLGQEHRRDSRGRELPGLSLEGHAEAYAACAFVFDDGGRRPEVLDLDNGRVPSLA
mmetsp:Transcript_15328/g.49192  ORF Transcript_15328/g.49192 Transcript_15328/m.49192 type:complete len:662 (-) Transcript_15328:290-2275(-)